MEKHLTKYKTSSPLLWRVISSVILLLTVFGFLLLKEKGVFALLMALAFFMAFEWSAMCKITLRRRAACTILLSVCGALTSIFLGYTFFGIGVLFLTASVNIFLGWLTWRRGFLWLAFGILYIGLPLGMLLWISHTVLDAMPLLIWIVVLVAANDSGGYFIGKFVGGVKLAPSISPNKTWSGFFGGILFVFMATGIFYYFYPMGTSFTDYLFSSFIIAVIASLGDLLESSIKRYHGVKDSGNLIPGHGGVLDRLDSYFMVIPAVALMIYLAPQALLSSEQLLTQPTEEIVLLTKTNKVE